MSYSERCEVKCGPDCILRKLPNGEHTISIPDDVIDDRWCRCAYDCYLFYKVPSRNTVIINRREGSCCRS